MILIQTYTKSLIDQALGSEAHAYLLSGPEGSGKGFLARHMASQRLGLKEPTTLATQPYVKIIAPLDASIGIDQVRELQKFLRLKTLGRGAIRRVAIVENAHTMTLEAQNALLKSLEEPPVDTVIILTSPATRHLRETIYSRVQTIAVLPIPLAQAQEHFSKDFEPAAVEKAHQISGGHIGLLHALLQDQDHELVQTIQRAKEVLAGTTFDRLAKVDELSKQKDSLPSFLRACRLIVSAALQQALVKNNRPAMKRWHHAGAALHEAEANLSHSPNTKLLLTHLFLQI